MRKHRITLTFNLIGEDKDAYSQVPHQATLDAIRTSGGTDFPATCSSAWSCEIADRRIVSSSV